MKLTSLLPLLITSAWAAITSPYNVTSIPKSNNLGADTDSELTAVTGPVQNCPVPGVCYSLQDYGSEIQFTFQYPSSSGWLALGTGIWMEGSTMMIVWRNPDNTFTVSDRVAGGIVEPIATPTQASKIVTSESKVENGNNIVVFRRAKTTSEKTLAKFDAAQTNWIWAISGTAPKGSSPSTTLAIHDNSGKFDLDVTKGTTGGATVSSGYGMKYIIHGVLMFLGWNLMPYLGILAAGPFKKILGVWWFRIHVALLGFAGPALVLGGFVLVIIANGNAHFRGPHSIIGLLTVILQALQIVLGVVIDRLWNPERTSIPWYDKLHWYGGRILFVLAQVTIVLGLLLYDTPNSLKVYWILFGILLFLEVASLIVLTIMMKKRQAHEK